MKTIRFARGQTLAFDGDSLTALRSSPGLDQWPWLRISNNHRSWADVFAELMFCWRPELELTFRTVAVGGSSCRGVMARFETMVTPLRPDWVFMTLGGNDARREIPLAEFEQSLTTYARRLAGWSGHLVFLVGFQPCPNAAPEAEQKYAMRGPYYEVEQRLAAELDNVFAVDAGTGLLQKARALYAQYPGHNVYSDGGHFSNLGATIVAGELLKALRVLD